MTPQSWISDKFATKDPDGTLGPEDDFIAAGIIDSFGIIELIEEIEASFPIKFTREDFERRSLLTKAGLSAIIEDKLAS